MVTHREPSQSVQLTGTDSISDEAPVAERDGSVRAGVVSLRTRFWSMAFLQLLCRTRVELDGQRHVLAWGQLRVPVVAGWHQLRVSFRYLWMDCGAATKDFDVRGGHIVELTYRAPWLVFLRGKLRLSREDRPLVAQETPSALAGSAPPLRSRSRSGWHTDPSDGHQRRWWDGERWTPATFRSESRARKAWVVAVAVVTLIVALNVASAIASADSDDSATLAESAEWVTVTEIDGVRFDMPIRPEHWTEPIPGTDLTIDSYSVYNDNMAMSVAAVAAEVPGDTRTDTMILHDAVDGTADDTDGTIVFTREAVVDGEPGLDFEVSIPRDGGTTVLGRAALDGDLLVLVETVVNHDDLAAAAGPHNRMARSITFEG